MKNVIDKEWLLKNLNERMVRIVDCRFSLAEPENGSQEYEKGHLLGAVFFDLEKDMSGPVRVHGGRHPLPNIEEFILKIKKAGIDENTVVVAYDQGEGAFAARFWWLLQYLGHEKVYVLDGGFRGWVDAHFPVTTEIPTYEEAVFIDDRNHELIATMEDVKEVVLGKTANVILIDSREEKRYLGVEEPIDKKAGHIPGSINKPWFEGLNGGLYKKVEEQKQRLADVDFQKQLIVYCGSGVTAAPNFLALKEAGFEKVKLYVGSFSDWISYPENQIT